jgi:hypothetical protein
MGSRWASRIPVGRVALGRRWTAAPAVSAGFDELAGSLWRKTGRARKQRSQRARQRAGARRSHDVHGVMESWR